jgi:tetratricopeptide (TPR) repeat protein
MEEQDTGDAEMYFLRYLRKNPNGDRRWDVWQTLLSIALDIRQDKAVAKDYLEIMLAEFSADAGRTRDISLQLARLCGEMRFFSRAEALWETLAADPGLGAEQKALAYKEMAYGFLRRLEFRPAAEVLEHCLQLKAGADQTADCYYVLAQTQTLLEDLGAAEGALQNMLKLDGLSEDRRTAGIFMLAEVVEQQNRPDEARRLLEGIMHAYPNSKVIEIRLGSLGKQSPSPRQAPGTQRAGKRNKAD